MTVCWVFLIVCEMCWSTIRIKLQNPGLEQFHFRVKPYQMAFAIFAHPVEGRQGKIGHKWTVWSSVRDPATEDFPPCGYLRYASSFQKCTDKEPGLPPDYTVGTPSLQDQCSKAALPGYLRLQWDLHQLEQWAKEWHTVFNPDKCEVWHSAKSNHGKTCTANGGALGSVVE